VSAGPDQAPLTSLRRALATQDLGRIDADWQVLMTASSPLVQAAATLFAQHGLHERAALLREQLGELLEAQALWMTCGLVGEAGRVAEQLGDEQTAEQLYREAHDSLSISELRLATASQDRRSPRLRLGLLLLRQGRPDEAVPVLQAARLPLLGRQTPDSLLLDELEPAIAAGLRQLGLPEAALPLHEAFRSRHPTTPLTVDEWLAEHAVAQRLPPKLLLGRYRLHKLLGAGGMGRVFLAEDVLTRQLVALKLLPLTATSSDSSQKWRRFCDEAKILRALPHPNIVAIQDFSESAGILVMEYMRGGSLGEQPLPLTLTKAQRVLRDVTEGLTVAHAAAVLHRDLKPHNLFLDPAHNTKIGDFGAALLAQLGATQTESLVGTLAYMSPEQLSGQPLSFASDLYSLGVTLFQLLTGRLPFGGPDWATQHLFQPAPDPRQHRPQLPTDWAALSLQLLAKSPHDRPSSLEALKQQIRQLPTEDEPATQAIAPGSLPAADELLLPRLEEADLLPTPRLGLTLLARTPHSELFHCVDARLARSLVVERFAAEQFASPEGQRHLRWLRAMARLGGPGLQRVLRINLDGPSPEVHYEEPVGRALSEHELLSRQDGVLLLHTLTAIAQAGEVHGSVADSVVLEKYGPLLLLAGRGPLAWPTTAPTTAHDRAGLEPLLETSEKPP